MQRVAFIPLYDEYCLGVRYMSSILKQDGHDVNIIIHHGVEYISPMEVPPPEKQEEDGYYSMCTYITGTEMRMMIELLQQKDVDLVGISFTSISFGLAKFVTKRIKEAMPNVKVIWGGVDSTMNANENIQFTDMVCIGEGEYPMRTLVDRMDKGGDVDHVPSIWVNKGDGEIIRNPTQKLEQDIDNYPFPDFELEDKWVIIDDQFYPSPFPPRSHLYTNFIIMTTRGCPFTCTYCCSGHDDVMYKGDRFLRRRSVNNVIEELRYRSRTWPWPLERIEFYDDVLPLNKRWLNEFSPRYATEVALPFFGYTHPNVGDPELLKPLGEAGLSYIIMGIQSGSQRTQREYYDRRHPKEQTIQTIRNIQDVGASVLVDFIGYNPLEREEDNLETLDLILDLPQPVGIIKINPMAFYDNYKIYHTAHKEGILDQLERPKGVHALQAKPNPYFVYWEMIHTLAHFENFSREGIQTLVQDQHLRKNPGILEEIVTNLYNATYQDANPVVRKDDYVMGLRGRIAQLEGSSMYKAFRKIKRLVA